MTMEQKISPTKVKQKRSINKLLMPHKIPNKVGVAVSRSQSAKTQNPRLGSSCEETEAPRSPLNTRDRPLSLDVSNLSPKKLGKHVQVNNLI